MRVLNICAMMDDAHDATRGFFVNVVHSIIFDYFRVRKVIEQKEKKKKI